MVTTDRVNMEQSALEDGMAEFCKNKKNRAGEQAAVSQMQTILVGNSKTVLERLLCTV